jgi:hypothetical protein
MKLTASLIDKLILLRDGESIPASQLRGEWVDELEHDGVIVSTSHGSRRTIFAPRPDALLKALSAFDERLSDLDLMRDTILTGGTSRSVQASATGNSKLLTIRSCPGFPVNTYESITCKLSGREIKVNPEAGSFLFITDWQSFTIPQDIVVVGIENMENFRVIRQQRALFEQTIGSDRLLFVSRYPQSADLRSWLQSIPNRYVHFGDFDLAGIHIFLTEFHAYLGERSSFFIPTDIEQRLAGGSMERYNAQYHKFKNLATTILGLQHLIDTINNYHRCYDQEGYINISTFASVQLDGYKTVLNAT